MGIQNYYVFAEDIGRYFVEIEYEIQMSLSHDRRFKSMDQLYSVQCTLNCIPSQYQTKSKIKQLTFYALRIYSMM